MVEKFLFQFQPAKDFVNVGKLIGSMGPNPRVTITANPYGLTFRENPENKLGFLAVDIKQNAEGFAKFEVTDGNSVTTVMDLTNILKWFESVGEQEILTGTMYPSGLKFSLVGKDRRELKQTALGPEFEPVEDIVQKFKRGIFASRFECSITRLQGMIRGVTLGERFAMQLTKEGIRFTSHVGPQQFKSTQKEPELEGDESNGLIEVGESNGDAQLLPHVTVQWKNESDDSVSLKPPKDWTPEAQKEKSTPWILQQNDEGVKFDLRGVFDASKVNDALTAFLKFDDSIQCGFSDASMMLQLPEKSPKREHYDIRYVIMAKMRARRTTGNS